MASGLIIGGGGLQLVGFAMALYQSVSTRWSQVPEERSVFILTVGWVRRTVEQAASRLRLLVNQALIRMGRKEVSTAPTTGGGGRGVVTAGAITRAEGGFIPLEERIQRMERRLADIQREGREQNDKTRQDIAAIRAREVERDAQLVRRLGYQLHLEEAGTVLFVIGVVLTMVGGTLA
jgi:hypothetical protein